MILQEKDEKTGEYKTIVVEDPIVGKVIYSFAKRSDIGIKKYNETLESNNFDNYYNHLAEELQDAVNYCFKIKEQHSHITELVSRYGNDADLGAAVRQYYSKKKS